eukprot:TRINITY_DN8653_c0_g1_i1.p1 TRINITY_DN8653_c0_g1~~TRINITY_DN8653_c0_g1_i1.p1  ORF type:complete len:327 (+),score=182.29 TRINITY_DN8653_c0_g1_i1:45-1025(+)
MTSMEESSMKPTMFLEQVAKMPAGVRENVLALQALQAQYQELFLKFCKEKAEVEAKYEDMCLPLYEKRRKIVTGESEPTEEEIKKGEPAEEESKVEEIEDEDEEKKDEAEEAPAAVEDAEKGIPKFWLTAMRNEPELAQLIEDQDEDILEYLIDVSSKRLEEPHGFELTFQFSENPHFTETVLTKKYLTKLDEDDGEIMLEKAEGCKISWKEGMNPTRKTKKKRQQSKTGKGHRVVDKVVSVDSFFNFFSPPYAADEDMTEEMADKMQTDYSAGCCFKERLVPRGVAWFTGEAALSYLGGMPDFDEDDDDDDEEGGPAGGADCKQQ